LSRGKESVVERKVALPVRWLKGFVEVQAYQARMVRKMEVSGFEAARFLRSLPRGSATTSGWVVPSGRGLRLSQVAAGGGIRVGGVQRLHIMDDLARHAKALRIYADEQNQGSAWELVLDEARFTLALSPDVSRGFSGEGQVLTDLANRRWEETLPRVHASLKWDTRIEPDDLASASAFDRETVTAALGVLGARGLVGYDLAERAYFHRELPFDLEKVEALQPRLLDARKLVGSGGVRIERNDATTGQVEAAVQGTEVQHLVRLGPDGERCTCPWYAKHRNERGPCKHILAVQITLDDEGDR
jgi:predicted nucleic acid-binding Zn finger protein